MIDNIRFFFLAVLISTCLNCLHVMVTHMCPKDSEVNSYTFIFRATVTDIDVWRKLSRNWEHFFWLTGETPDTLDVIIDRLQHRMNIFRRCGRISFMSTRNQVTCLPQFQI